jgi:glycosyltransferase involved in cell wall biosynthesis
MRLLLIAYEFPPSPSPQSLRWTYLTRELAARGHEIHVLAPDLGGDSPGLPELPPGVTIHRCFAGPFRGLMAMRRKRRQRLAAVAAQTDVALQPAGLTMLRPPRNWKQRVSETMQAALEYVLFPDLRGEWKPWATRALDRVLDTVRPDIVISSHEPATSLELGLQAKARGHRWIADLGDPVLAGYTPARWRRRAWRVEQATCRGADLVTVTNPATAELLRGRHGDPRAVEVVPQGFDARPPALAPSDIFDAARLELLYTGSLYRFRRIDALLAALRAHPSARLNIAAITVPEHILQWAQAAPDQVRLLGFLPHTAILQLQRQSDLLVNIANEDVTQIPGKFYEYLGAQRPILHLGAPHDPISELVRGLRRGWVCGNDEASLAALLGRFVRSHAEGRLDTGLQLGLEPVEGYSWQAIAGRVEHRLQALAGGAIPR